MAELDLLKRLGLPSRISNQKVVSSVLPLLKTLSEQDPDEFAVVYAEFKDYKACTVRDIGIVANFYHAYNKRCSTKVLTDYEISRVLDDNFDYLPKNLKPGMLAELVTTYFNKWADVEGFEEVLKEIYLSDEFQENIDYLEQNGYEVGMFSNDLLMESLCPRKSDWFNGCIEWGVDSEYEVCERDKAITMNAPLKDALENLFSLYLDELKEYENKYMARVVLTTLKECMSNRVESVGDEGEDAKEKRWTEVEKRIAASAEIVKEKQDVLQRINQIIQTGN